MKITDRKKIVVELINNMASSRNSWIRKNRYYYTELTKFLKYNIPEGSEVLEIGCGTGEILASLKPKRGVGIDISAKMIEIAKKQYQNLEFEVMDAEKLKLNGEFDYVIISDTIGYFEDVQKVFHALKNVTYRSTRVVITYQNFLWMPVLGLAELLRFKMPSKKLNWLNLDDIVNLLEIEGYEMVKQGNRFIFPFYIPIISLLLNRYIGNLPLINHLGLIGYVVARPTGKVKKKDYSVSVIVPARNEKGNIENIVKRAPRIGNSTEIIFIEGHSGDGTLEEIKRVCQTYRSDKKLLYAIQTGKGKGDAVRKGFDLASGEILMILDADLTVPPEDLPKFYSALVSDKAELVNGSRLVYPMEREAMQTLNILGNRFFSIMFTWLLGQKIKDTLCGTKVMFKDDYIKIAHNRCFFGNFDPFGDFDLIFGAAKLNLKIKDIPIRYRARQYGDTNISRFKHGWLLLKMVLFAMNKIKFI